VRRQHGDETAIEEEIEQAGGLEECWNAVM
jgi:hypothetical protein